MALEMAFVSSSTRPFAELVVTIFCLACLLQKFDMSPLPIQPHVKKVGRFPNPSEQGDSNHVPSSGMNPLCGASFVVCSMEQLKRQDSVFIHWPFSESIVMSKMVDAFHNMYRQAFRSTGNLAIARRFYREEKTYWCRHAIVSPANLW